MSISTAKHIVLPFFLLHKWGEKAEISLVPFLRPTLPSCGKYVDMHML